MPDSIAAILQSVPVFEGLSPEELLLVARSCTEVTVGAEELVCTAGEEGSQLYILTSGQVAVETVTGAGELKQLALLSQGHIFGEFAFIHMGPRLVSIRASQPCTLLRLECEDLERLCLQDSHLGFTLMRNLARRVCRRLRELDLSLLMSEEEQEEQTGGLLSWLGFGRAGPEEIVE